jgi:hypothetical protein
MAREGYLEMSGSDSKDYFYNSFESPLRESMANTVWEIDKLRFQLINSHHGLDKKELCVCLGFCSAIWDTNYNTTRDTVIDSVFHEGKAWYMKENGKPLFTSEEEVKQVIERLEAKGIMRASIGCTVNGFRGKCRSRICPKVFYHLVSYLNMRPEIENDARLIVSQLNFFRG